MPLTLGNWVCLLLFLLDKESAFWDFLSIFVDMKLSSVLQLHVFCVHSAHTCEMITFNDFLFQIHQGTRQDIARNVGKVINLKLPFFQKDLKPLHLGPHWAYSVSQWWFFKILSIRISKCWSLNYKNNILWTICDIFRLLKVLGVHP